MTLFANRHFARSSSKKFSRKRQVLGWLLAFRIVRDERCEALAVRHKIVVGVGVKSPQASLSPHPRVASECGPHAAQFAGKVRDLEKDALSNGAAAAA
jgi:hypothetical protein